MALITQKSKKTQKNKLVTDRELDNAIDDISSLNELLGAKNPAVYVARLEAQDDGSDPVIVSSESDLDSPIAWERVGVGEYNGVLASAFPNAKTYLLVNMPPREIGTEVVVSFQRNDDDSVYLNIFEADGSTKVDGFKATVRIEVYR